jgi:D-glycero-alpha-D-manno-heptose 1-phosphate guanylyltransferase
MRAIILCGGFGTRLRQITGEQVPKCMVKGWFKPGTREIPWLRIVIDNLKSQSIEDITLSLHYKPEVFTDYWGDKLKYKIEPEPLGTGGAIKNCLEESDKNNPILVLNGDTYAKCDFQEMLAIHKAPLTVAIAENGAESAGVYILNQSLFFNAPSGAFSFEEFIKDRKKKYYIIPFFTDMGTPEGYKKAQV